MSKMLIFSRGANSSKFRIDAKSEQSETLGYSCFHTRRISCLDRENPRIMEKSQGRGKEPKS